MAHLWVEQRGDWAAVVLGSEPIALAADTDRPVYRVEAPISATHAAVLMPTNTSGAEWVLVCKPGLCRVNGIPNLLGIAVMQDRDEIHMESGPRLYFSKESQATIAPFDRVGEIACARCSLPIEPGQPTVICPACKIAYHQDVDADLPCWTYGSCLICGNPGTLDGGLAWSPAEL